MSCECGCCSGVHAATPVPVHNRPGLSSIAHRPGDWSTYLASLQASLSSARFPELAGLTTRAADDASMALCDAWAVAAEVLSFYQDRIANEGYLRTAIERRSLIELGRLTGYTLRPGVSASVYLSYELDANAGRVAIPAGTRAQSVPGAGEKMQTFETVEPLEARAEWSRVAVRQSQPAWRFRDAADPLYGVLARGLTLAGTATQLKANDALLIDYGDGRPEPYRVAAVAPDDAAQTTHVRVALWDGAQAEDGGSDKVKAPPLRVQGLVEALRNKLHVQPRDATRVSRDQRTALRPGGEIYSRILSHQSPALRDMLIPALRSFDAAGETVAPIKVYALRAKAGVFGSAAPNLVLRWGTDGSAVLASAAATDFVGLTIGLAWAGLPGMTGREGDDPVALDWLPLDGLHESIKPGGTDADPSWVLVDPPAGAGDDGLQRGVFPLERNETVTMTIGGAISMKTSRLQTREPWCKLSAGTIGGTGAASLSILRETLVYAQSELLPLARDPITDPVRQIDDTREIELDGYYDALEPGMWVIAAGDRADIADPGLAVPAAERAMIAGVRHDVARVSWKRANDGGGESGDADREGSPLPGDTLHTFVELETPLAYSYRRPTFTLHGNVTRATHGETCRETLGGGDSSQAFQRFTLKSPPLTHVPAPTASGVASTLSVRVNRLLWRETADMPALPADARVYATSRDVDEATTVHFGDGVHGARLSSGADNVTSVYRTGLGSAGNVRAGQVSLPTDKPLGVKGVTNPIRASGGAEPDTILQARTNAPIAVTALDRLVSVQDYADFASGYAGIGKATATMLRDGSRAVVHLTVAGIDDEPIDETSELYLNLVASLRRYGDPHQPLRVQVREALSLAVQARIAMDPEYEWDDVQRRVRDALLERFGFAAAQLARPVILSRLLAAIEVVRGVAHVDALAVRALDEDALVAGIDPVAAESKNGSHAVSLDQAPRRQPWIAVAAASVIGTDQYAPAQIAYLPADVPDTLILELAP